MTVLLRRIVRKVHRTTSEYFQRKRFKNKDFWNDRYSTNMEKGSGPGSRGDILEFKSRLISEHMKNHDVRSILDLGCGDIEILKDLQIERYLGVDISDVIVTRNQNIKPNWQFVCSDIGQVSIDSDFDMTLCLDVLIHQKHRSDYESIATKVFEVNSPVIVVSGYTRKPDGWTVFFHEPLQVTLARLGPGREFALAGSYRDTELFVSVL